MRRVSKAPRLATMRRGDAMSFPGQVGRGLKNSAYGCRRPGRVPDTNPRFGTRRAARCASAVADDQRRMLLARRFAGLA